MSSRQTRYLDFLDKQNNRYAVKLLAGTRSLSQHKQ